MGDRGIPKTWAAHERLLEPHLHVGQRGRRQVLGQVPLQDRPGRRVPHPGGRRPDRRENGDYHRQDLFETIRDGDFPTWTLYMQIMPFEEAKTYRFNPFDLTKVWPHDDYPLIKVAHAHAEPQHDRFSHREWSRPRSSPTTSSRGSDSARTRCCWRVASPTPTPTGPRLGVNYKQIPVNSPIAPVHSYSKDGVGRKGQRDRPGVTRPTPMAVRRPTRRADRRRGAVGG